MLLEPRPQRLRRLTASVLRQCRDVERRVGRRRAEQAVQYPGATQHGRGAIGIRGQHQDGALSQQAVARLVVERHATEVAALDRLDAVVHRQALVEEGVVRRQQLDHAAIAAQDAVDEQPQLLLEHRAGIQQAARVGELASVRGDLVQLGEVEPLEREIVAQRLGPRVGKHPAHLSGQHVGIAEARFGGELQELLIRQAAPQEEGQTRRQLQIAQRASPAGRVSGFRPIEEMRARQDRAERIAHAAFEACRRVSRLVERHQGIEILGGHRAPEGAPCEVLDDLVRAGLPRRAASSLGLADEDLRAAGRLRSCR